MNKKTTKKGRKKKNINKKRLLAIALIFIIIILVLFGIIKVLTGALKKEQGIGNNSNNNMGLATRGTASTIYYNKYDEGIVKSKNGKETSLTNESAYSITVVGDKVYYLTTSEQRNRVIKYVTTDGNENEEVKTINTNLTKFYVDSKEEYIYYVSNETSVKIVKLSLDTLEETTLVESSVQDFSLYKDKIYYTNNNGQLYLMDTNGENIEEITGLEEDVEYNIKNFQVQGRWIYFYSSSENALCKIRNDGKKMQVVSTLVNSDMFNITDKKIYYFDATSQQICRCNLNGKKSVAIAKLQAVRTKISIVNGILYYIDSENGQDYYMYRIKVNGNATNSIDY